MKVEIKVPPMGESISEATIGSFLKPHGAAVKEAEEVIEIETEKVNQPLYAPANGAVNWTVKEGDTVEIGAVIGFIDTEQKGAAAPEAEPPPKVEKRELPKVEGEIRKKADSFISSLHEKEEPKIVSIETRKPTGRESRLKMSRIRKTIANRLVDSLHEAAMLTTFNEVDMSAVMAMRAKYKESFLKAHGVKLGFMSFFTKAVVEALKAFPDFNSYLDGEEIVQRHYYDIGIAVGTDRGLLVPVVRDCDQLTLAQIEQQIAEFATRARKGALRIEDLEGGGFTITNGGVYGSLLSTPILNPPQVGILGMHAIMNRPMAVDGQLEIRPMMYVALSYDHRIVDGKEAVSFLVHLKKSLEDPACMMLL